MELNEAKEKILKLLRLSKSPNEHEAARALEFANKLMEEYKLDESQCRTYEQKRVKATKRRSQWRSLISGNVAWLYSVYVVSDYYEGEKLFIGESIDAFLAAEMYQYLCKSVERIARQSIRKNAKHKYRESFKNGCAANICCRIRTLGKACSWAPEREKNIQLAKEYTHSIMNLEKDDAKKTKMNSKAYMRGIDKGQSISLNKQATASAGRMISGW